MIIPDEAVAAARHAYVAHRFEPFRIGFHPEVYTADLVGAYSWALTTIGCLAHGEWEHNRRALQRETLRDMKWNRERWPTMRLVEWDVPTSKRRSFGPFPWRYPDGAICYPKRGAAWVWHPEYEAALRIWGPKPFTVHDAWSFVPSCDHRPWDPILELLPKRAGFPALKAMLNSIPGKLAQSRPKPGPWFDPMTAGLVTATVRARMLEALAAAGNSVIGCVADALWTTKPIDLQHPRGYSPRKEQGNVRGNRSNRAGQAGAGVVLSGIGATVPPGTLGGNPEEQESWHLRSSERAGGGPERPESRQGPEQGRLVPLSSGKPGSWKFGHHSDVLFVQSGLAFGDPDEEHPWGVGLASQGTPATALSDLAGDFRAAWDLDGINAALEVPYRHFVGIPEAVAADLPNVGYWTEAKHWVRFNPLRKRDEGSPVVAGKSFHMTTTAPITPDPSYYYLGGDEPATVGKSPLSSPYWNEAWEACADPIDDLWPTDADRIVL